MIVNSTVQEKAIAHPTYSKLLETTRSKLVEEAKTNGIELKQTFAKEGQQLDFRAGRYNLAFQFKACTKSLSANAPSSDACRAS